MLKRKKYVNRKETTMLMKKPVVIYGYFLRKILYKNLQKKSKNIAVNVEKNICNLLS